MNAGGEGLRAIAGAPEATVTAFVPRGVTREAARLANSLCARLPATVQTGSAGCVVDLADPETLPGTTWCVEVHLNLHASTLSLVLSEACLEALLGREMAPKAFLNLPGPLRTGLTAVATEDLLDALSSLLGRGVALADVTTTPRPPAAADLAFSARFAGGEGAFCLRDGPAARKLVAWLIGVSPTTGARPPGLSFPVGIEMGPVTLSLEELRSLRHGDVVMPGAPLDVDRFLLRVAGSIRAYAVRQDGDYRLERITMTEDKRENVPEDTADPRSDESPLIDSESLTVAVTVEVGCAEFELDALTALRPGSVLSIPGSSPERALIRANGRVVARGELVQVGGELGVRVLGGRDGEGRDDA